MLLDAVEVDGAVAVVVGDRLAVVGLALVQVIDVVVPGVEPKRRDAEVLQVRQAVDDPAQVAAVVVARLRAVEQASRHGRVVVRRVAVREAVGHDEVDDVVGREALEAAVPRQGGEQLQRHGGGAGGRLQRDRPRARRGVRVDRHVDERVRPGVVHLHRPGREARPDHADRRPRQVRPAHQQPHRVDGVPGPPARRLDLRHRRRGGPRRGRGDSDDDGRGSALHPYPTSSSRTRSVSAAARSIDTPPTRRARVASLPRKRSTTKPRPTEATICGSTMKKLKTPM